MNRAGSRVGIPGNPALRLASKLMMTFAPDRSGTTQRGARTPAAPPAGSRSEDGFILVVVMFMLALLIIGMAVALPKMATQIQRDREIETYHRGMQYRRAIQLYFRKFNRYPPNMEALVKTNEMRFLRKKYIDPMTGKDDWKPVMVGQNKTPMAMGFFGQPLGGMGMGGAAMAGIGPGGIAGGNPLGNGGGIGNSTFGGNSSVGNSTFGGNSGSSSIFASNNNTGTNGSNTVTPTSGGTDANGNPVDPNTGSSPIAAGPTFGGAGIIGVSPASPKLSLFVYKKKNHYLDWEFLYSPLSDQMTMSGGNSGAIQPSQPGFGAPGTGFSPPGGTTGTGFNGTGTGTDPGTGTGTGTGTPTTPTQPQP